MKAVFLDIDGVLNSYSYDMKRTENDGNIDKTRLLVLKQVIDKTGAKIVLSSSWRVHWDKDPDICDDIGKEINSVFWEAGLEIYDKTPKVGYLERAEEVRIWLKDNPGVTSFVILDDNGYGWGDLSKNLINTNYRIGRGLDQKHVLDAIKLLEQHHTLQT